MAFNQRTLICDHLAIDGNRAAQVGRKRVALLARIRVDSVCKRSSYGCTFGNRYSLGSIRRTSLAFVFGWALRFGQSRGSGLIRPIGSVGICAHLLVGAVISS